ncbi:OLC1v1012351C1 [Oldenlandia corymbosa var. corymbosa]|nr:OLC1v1012351C1 [Oldenlandia corymbosa var. corymbosa]
MATDGIVMLASWLIMLATLMVLQTTNVNASRVEELCNLEPGDNFLFCVECLKGKGHHNSTHHIQGETQDQKFGRKSIDCARRSTVIAQDAMEALSNNTGGKLQDAARFCSSKLGVVVSWFELALTWWSYKRKSDTLRCIRGGQDEYHQCAVEISDEEIPPALDRMLDCTRARSDVAYTLIKSIIV